MHAHSGRLSGLSIFCTGESTFEVRGSTETRGWCRLGKHILPMCLRPTIKGGRQSLMVWGGLFSRGRTPLLRSEGVMNAEEYEDILMDDIFIHVFADLAKAYGARLQEDLARRHAAKRSKATKTELGLHVRP